jgi:hypothetical protein
MIGGEKDTNQRFDMRRAAMLLSVVLPLASGLLPSGLTTSAVTQRGDPAERLSGAKTVRCEFSTMASGDWKGGVPQGTIKQAKMSLRFENVDADGGTAQAIGQFGPSDVNVRVTTSSLHFLQSFREGPLYLTTLIGRPAPDGRMLAVHTRHEYTDVSLPGYTSRPEQYYGLCSIEP